MIAVAGRNNAPLRNETILAVNNWLKNTRGLIYIHGKLATANTKEASTPEDHDGKLTADWLWEDAFIYKNGHYTVHSDKQVEVLKGPEEAAKRILWQGRNTKGCVLFSAFKGNAVRLQKKINRICEERNLELQLGGTPGIQKYSDDSITAVATDSKTSTPVTLKGVELYSGNPNPKVGTRATAAIVADGFKGQYTASVNGVAVLSPGILTDCEPVPNGMKVASDDVIRASAVSGPVTVQRVDGKTLPSVEKRIESKLEAEAGDEKDDAAKEENTKTAEDADANADADGQADKHHRLEHMRNQWILYGKKPGLTVVKIPQENEQVFYIRSPVPVSITAAE